jgi:hypothetical protein
MTCMANGVMAYERVGPANVRMEGLNICFSVGQEELSQAGGEVKLKSVLVFDRSALPVRDIWSISFPRESRLVISNDVCVPYGIEAGGGVVSASSVKLQVNKLYNVYLNAEMPSDTDPTSGYVADFCMASVEGGGSRPVLVRGGVKDGLGDFECVP